MSKKNCLEFAGGEQGFSLVEVVLAMAVLGVLGVSLLSLLGNSFTFGINAGQKSQALGLTQEKMEQFSAMSYEQLLDEAKLIDQNFSCPGGKMQSCKEKVPGFEQMERSFQIECVEVQAAGYSIPTFKITVETVYPGAGQGSVVLTSYLRGKR